MTPFHDDSTTNLQDHNTMSETKIKLWVYIEGRNSAFSVSISPRSTIDDLCKQIYDEHVAKFIVECGSAELTPTKVRYIMTSK